MNKGNILAALPTPIGPSCPETPHQLFQTNNNNELGSYKGTSISPTHHRKSILGSNLRRRIGFSRGISQHADLFYFLRNNEPHHLKYASQNSFWNCKNNSCVFKMAMFSFWKSSGLKQNIQRRKGKERKNLKKVKGERNSRSFRNKVEQAQHK